MKVRVHNISGPAWQPVKDGKPYNKYVGTVELTDAEHVMFGRRYYMVIANESKEQVEKNLDKYLIGEIINVPEDKLIAPRI